MKKIFFICLMLVNAFAASAQNEKYLEAGAKPKVNKAQMQKMMPEKKGITDADKLIDMKANFEDRIFTVAEFPARFPEENATVEEWIQANLMWPSDVPEDIEGTIYVRVVVEKDGKLTSPEIRESLYPDFDTEALRIIGLMPSWIPAKMHGEPVRTYVTIPVVFEKQN